MRRCVVCEARADGDFCPECRRSFDRWVRSKANDDTRIALVEWAAARARTAMRQRVRRAINP